MGKFDVQIVAFLATSCCSKIQVIPKQKRSQPPEDCNEVTGIRYNKIRARIGVTRRRGRRCKQPMNDSKETRGYWKLKEEALDITLRRTRCGRSNGPVA